MATYIQIRIILSTASQHKTTLALCIQTYEWSGKHFSVTLDVFSQALEALFIA